MRGWSLGAIPAVCCARATRLCAAWLSASAASIIWPEFSDGGVNLSQVKKIIIGTGDGTNSGQPDEDKDILYIDDIRLCPPECTLTSRGDVNGDCRIDLKDFSIMAGDWLSEG